MDFGTVLTLVQTLLVVVESEKLREMCSMFDYKSELKELWTTISTVKAVLLDAEAKQESLNNEAQLFTEELKDAVYDADDLLDEFVTRTKRKKLMDDQEFFTKVSLFFSRDNQLGVAYKLSQGVKKIKNRLDAIASNHSKFNLSVDHEPIRRKRKETCSYVYANDIIGREADVKEILYWLLGSSVERDVSFLSIVGMGGLGKTALAQLVFNDKRVKREFPLRLWACDGDQDTKNIDVDAILRKILCTKDDSLTLERVQSEIREKIGGKKYLLVLDDVWNEDRDQWLNLVGFLRGCQKGSWVVVTTRSTKTAEVIGTRFMYQLKGLSDEKSWSLFKMMAFSEDEQKDPSQEFFDIGKKIVESCHNVPLAIRALGSLLYGQGKVKWEDVLKRGLSNIRFDEKKGIMPVLRLSYDSLESPIKSCFSYCALFPQDFMIEKQMLFELWIAQGYVVPLEKDQNLLEVAEDYFLILLRRCFFQDVIEQNGEIIAFKIHDLMLDVARKVSKNEIYHVDSNTLIGVNERIRHVSVVGTQFTESSFTKSRIRTYVQVYTYISRLRAIDDVLLGEIITNSGRLRTLDLRYTTFRRLPNSVGKLLHLRKLDISGNEHLEELPKSITKLNNLMFLGIHGCVNLSYLPVGMGKLTHLYYLRRFMVGYANSSERQFFEELDDLGSLNNLRTDLEVIIQVPTHPNTAKDEDWRRRMRKGACEYLSQKEHLRAVNIKLESKDKMRRSDFEEALLEKLRPHSNLKELKLQGYHGLKMPNWAMENLEQLCLSDCWQLRCLPKLGTLRHLKKLKIEAMPEVEYVEDDTLEGFSYLACLEMVHLINLPKLKMWSRSPSSHYLPQLKDLTITRCQDMTSIPLCAFNPGLKISFPESKFMLFRECARIRDSHQTEEATSTVSHLSLSPANLCKPCTLTTNSVRNLKLIPTDGLSVRVLVIMNDYVDSLAEVKELFKSCTLSSLRSLAVIHCSKLRSISDWIEHCSALERLMIKDCPILLINDGIPWRRLPATLHSLSLSWYGDMVPEGLKHCTSLRSLSFSNCFNLRYLPEWMPELASLRQLRLYNCSIELEDVFRNPDAEYWSLVQHIPCFFVGSDFDIICDRTDNSAFLVDSDDDDYYHGCLSISI